MERVGTAPAVVRPSCQPHITSLAGARWRAAATGCAACGVRSLPLAGLAQLPAPLTGQPAAAGEGGPPAAARLGRGSMLGSDGLTIHIWHPTRPLLAPLAGPPHQHAARAEEALQHALHLLPQGRAEQELSEVQLQPQGGGSTEWALEGGAGPVCCRSGGRHRRVAGTHAGLCQLPRTRLPATGHRTAPAHRSNHAPGKGSGSCGEHPRGRNRPARTQSPSPPLSPGLLLQMPPGRPPGSSGPRQVRAAARAPPPPLGTLPPLG